MDTSGLDIFKGFDEPLDGRLVADPLVESVGQIRRKVDDVCAQRAHLWLDTIGDGATDVGGMSLRGEELKQRIGLRGVGETVVPQVESSHNVCDGLGQSQGTCIVKDAGLNKQMVVKPQVGLERVSVGVGRVVLFDTGKRASFGAVLPPVHLDLQVFAFFEDLQEIEFDILVLVQEEVELFEQTWDVDGEVDQPVKESSRLLLPRNREPIFIGQIGRLPR